MNPNDDTVLRAPRDEVVLVPDSEDIEDTIIVVKRPERGTKRDTAQDVARALELLMEETDDTPFVRAHYRIRIGDQSPIDIDRPLLLGRKPRAPRIWPGPEPLLVTVSSPDSEISATHLELRESGSAVVVTDLKSTNGTIVAIPGSPVRTLLAGESAVVTPGTLIDLGDGNLIEVLMPARLEGVS